MYTWSENSSSKSEAKHGAIGRQFQSISIVFSARSDTKLQRVYRNLVF
jgi:hypothetical protein